MTCRHRAGDPDCSANGGGYRASESYASSSATPDAANYTVLDVAQVGPHLVVKAQYPNCRSCAYEGVKVMVYLGVSPVDAMKWRKIDPHFADPKARRGPTEAPAPAARFPASTDGWRDAINYARAMEKVVGGA